MTDHSNTLMLVTGATGLVGSHVVEQARKQGLRTRALVRNLTDGELFKTWGAELVEGNLTDAASLNRAAQGVTHLVHCAAKVGDWGPVEGYRQVNVGGLEMLLNAVNTQGNLQRMIHISSLGVYEGRDHFGTDETTQPNIKGIDGYTLTKFESEELVLKQVREQQLPATVLRPGFIYGLRDRTILPRILERLRDEKFRFLGNGEQLMNNTYVGNLVQACFLALEKPESIGQVFNITDGRLVSKKEFIQTVARLADYPIPERSVPLGVAKVLARLMETSYRLLGKKEAPLLSSARIKFLGLNLDFCIDKARTQLGYEPQTSFEEAMATTMEWFNAQANSSKDDAQQSAA